MLVTKHKSYGLSWLLQQSCEADEETASEKWLDGPKVRI